jgi:hypothetical protein
MPEDYQEPRLAASNVALVTVAIIALLGLIFAILGFMRAGSAIEKADSSSRMAAAASDQYTALSSSWTTLADKVNAPPSVDQQHEVTEAMVSNDNGPSPFQEMSKAVQEGESDRRDIWNSLKKLSRRVRHIEKAQEAAVPEEKPVDVDKQDFYQDQKQEQPKQDEQPQEAPQPQQ